MKNMFESPEALTAYATIEAGVFMLQELLNNSGIGNVYKLSPINAAVDKATGYDKKRNNDLCDNATTIIKDIIEAKKTINADYSHEEELLSKIQSCRQS